MIRALLFLLLFPVVGFASGLTQEQRIEDFEQLVKLIQEDYGLLSFKRDNLNFDFKKTTETYRLAVENETSEESFKYLLAKYVGEFKDAHFSLRYNTKAIAKLGFAADLVQSSVVIGSIDRSLLTEAEFPFEKGDEIILWDNLPALTEARNVSQYLNVSYQPTGLRAGVFFLTYRKASRMPLPSGYATLVIKQRKTGLLKTVTLKWQIETAEPKVQKLQQLSLNDMCSEKSRIAPPAGANIIKDVPFTAFSFPSSKGVIGFIRIPHYYPQNVAGQEVAQERFNQYERVIAEFEKTTIGLIIDQDFNCGGSVVFVNKMFSLFTSKSFVPLSFSFRASQSQVDGLRRQLNKFTVKDDGFQEFKNVIDEIEKAKNKGLEMSEKLPMRGFMEVKVDLPTGNLLQPNAIRYTKPIVMLINEMSGSGGDVFPALMKDYGRAKLFGTRTMGAGGHLWSDPPAELKNTHAIIGLTRSIIYRPNGVPIENFGVEPDVQYQITLDDFLNGYEGYLKNAVDQL